MFRPIDVAEWLQRKPFEPFRIHVTGGMQYDVTHPEFVLVSPSRVMILVPWQDQPTMPYFDRTDSVALVHIVRLEKLQAEPASSSNN